MNWRRGARWLATAVVVTLALALFSERMQTPDALFLAGVPVLEQRSIQAQQNLVLFSELSMPRGLPFAALLEQLGLTSRRASLAIASIQGVFNLREVRAGNRISVGRTILGDLHELRYRIDAERTLLLAPAGPSFKAEVKTTPGRLEESALGGEIQGSLFESVTRIGETPELAMRLADIFAYDLDFYTDPRPGDTFRVLLQRKRLITGETAAYGPIWAAEYNNNGHVYRAILFHDAAGRGAYFTPDGKSLKRAFLHSPLKFAAPVTSHFSLSRFHPILKEYRPHLGIDYAAPTGTPVQSIADGRVLLAGRKGGAGNVVEVQHAGGYETYYLHLSRMLVRAGQRVHQGQRIGLVGMTGLATGPHLDFRIQKNGAFLNFERLRLSSSEPVWRRDWAQFAATRDRALAGLPDLRRLTAQSAPGAAARNAPQNPAAMNP